jgi:hypothetical protein
MSAPRLDSKTPIHFRAPSATLALTGIVPVLAVMALSPAVPKPGFLNFLSAHVVSEQAHPEWAGHLDAANSAPTAAEASETVRSTSYTSGFDPAAVGLAPLKDPPLPAHAAQHDPRGCAEESPDKIVDISHPPNGCSKTAKVFVLPSPRPVAPKTIVAGDKPASPQPDGFGNFQVYLPSPSQLLTPFNYVSDKVSGLFKRS